MHLHLNGRKIFLFGFIAVLLIGIPVTIYLLQRQQDTRSKAAPSTTLAFTPDTTQAPLQKNVGDTIALDIMVDPGSNIVSLVDFEIQYDPEKLEPASAQAFVPNPAVLPLVMEKGGPIYTPGKITVTLSAGPDPTKAVQTRSKAATVTFKAKAGTPPGTPTLVSYGANTKAYSIGSSDQYAEDVFSSGVPAQIVIGGPVVTTAPPLTVTPVPPTAGPTIDPGPSISASPSGQPTCSSLSVDRSTTGEAPLALTFTANGSDADGIINKVTFNFGDGQVSDETSTASGGIGSSAVNVPSSHTYPNPGVFTASALITDDSGLVSNSTSCKQTVTVNAIVTPSTVTAAPVTPAPSIASPGSTEVALGIGAVIAAFIIGGGLLFFLI